MDRQTQWEYRVETFGSIFRSVKPEDLEATLDEWGEDGWEVVTVYPLPNSTKVAVVAKRPLTVSARRRRSMP